MLSTGSCTWPFQQRRIALWVQGQQPMSVPLVQEDEPIRTPLASIRRPSCARASAQSLNCFQLFATLSGSSVREIFQVKILEWIANFLPSRGSSQPRDGACVFCIMHWWADSLLPHQLESPVVHMAFQL